MDKRQFIAAMDHIVAALRERGYDPYAQLTGYVTEEYPFIYYNNLLPSEYFFIDENGKEVN